MGELNVEKIMEEIRAEIKDKGYTSDILSFNDITPEGIRSKTEEFDWIKFNKELFNLNAIWNINPYREVEKKPGFKGKCLTLFKKVICKCIRFYIAPIVLEQDSFNAAVVRMLNMMNLFVEENMKLSDEIEKLKTEQEALKQEICLLENESA